MANRSQPGNPYGRGAAYPGSPFGPYGQPAPYGGRPPRRRSPFRALLRGLIFLLLLAGVGLALLNSTTQAPSDSYQNEQYQVPPPDRTPPPLPQPTTVNEAETFTKRNPFYRQTAPNPVRCEAQPINVATADDNQLDAHFESLMECLVRVWEPPVVGAGYQIVRPTVTIYGSSITTRCGTTEVNAFYCGADQQVYYSNRLAESVQIVATDKWAADVVMAHEFGHALQGRTGILISGRALGQQSGDKATDLELSRRLETQADCFSGMFMRSVREALGIQPADIAGIERTYLAVGDDVLTGRANVVGNHGRAESRRYWGRAGLNSSDVGTCNTFTASRSLVR